MDHPEVDINLENSIGVTPFNSAAYMGRLDCLKLLLQNPNCNFNKPNKKGSTPIHRAAFAGHHECLHLILSSAPIDRLDINKTNHTGMSPLHSAVLRDVNGSHIECVRLLLASPEIDVNKLTDIPVNDDDGDAADDDAEKEFKKMESRDRRAPLDLAHNKTIQKMLRDKGAKSKSDCVLS